MSACFFAFMYFAGWKRQTSQIGKKIKTKKFNIRQRTPERRRKRANYYIYVFFFSTRHTHCVKRWQIEYSIARHTHKDTLTHTYIRTHAERSNRKRIVCACEWVSEWMSLYLPACLPACLCMCLCNWELSNRNFLVGCVLNCCVRTHNSRI